MIQGICFSAESSANSLFPSRHQRLEGNYLSPHLSPFTRMADQKNNFSQRTILAVILALATGFIVHQLLTYDTLSRCVISDVAVRSDHDVLLYYRTNNGIKDAEYEDWKQSFPAPVSSYWSTARIQLSNAITPDVAIETLIPAKLEINNIVFRSYVAKDIVLNYKELIPLLKARSPATTIIASENWLVLENTTGPIQVEFKAPVRFNNFFIQYVMPFLLAAGMFFLVRRIDLLKIPAIGDMFHRKVGDHRFRVELDGLRGLAALLVLLNPTLTPLPASGRTGVWIFFILSGYLLTQPFVTAPERAVNWHYLSRYFRRRLARIVPMYYVTIVLMFGITGHYQSLVNHFVFLYTESHLWTIPQEMLFYLLLPFMMLVFYVVGKMSHYAVLVLLGVVAAKLIYQPHLIPFTMFATGIPFPPYIGWFLAGVFVCYLRPERLHEWLRTRGIARFSLSTLTFFVFVTD